MSDTFLRVIGMSVQTNHFTTSVRCSGRAHRSSASNSASAARIIVREDCHPEGRRFCGPWDLCTSKRLSFRARRRCCAERETPTLLPPQCRHSGNPTRNQARRAAFGLARRVSAGYGVQNVPSPFRGDTYLPPLAPPFVFFAGRTDVVFVPPRPIIADTRRCSSGVSCMMYRTSSSLWFRS
jgi:hypothetical protein